MRYSSVTVLFKTPFDLSNYLICFVTYMFYSKPSLIFPTFKILHGEKIKKDVYENENKSKKKKNENKNKNIEKK